jgi:hypothetical protein
MRIVLDVYDVTDAQHAIDCLKAMLPVLPLPGLMTPAPATQQPGTAAPATQQPGTAAPATQQPGTAAPATQQPATQQPATQPGTAATQAQQSPDIMWARLRLKKYLDDPVSKKIVTGVLTGQYNAKSLADVKDFGQFVKDVEHAIQGAS